jgi:hypothetical protein
MAQQLDQNLGMIYTLGVQPGIKRDGTSFESREFTDGVWARFQRGTPRKTGGYRQMFRDSNGIARGMIVNAYNGLNYLFAGNATTIDAFTTGTTLGAGNGPFPCVMNVGYAEEPVIATGVNDFDVTGDQTAKYPIGTKVVFDQTPGAQIYTVTGSVFVVNTTVTVTPAMPGTPPTSVWLADTYYQPDVDNLWQFDIQYNPQGGALEVIAHPGQNLLNIDSGFQTQVYAGDILPGPGNVWNFYGLSDSEGGNPTFAPITTDGGVCVLYPFIFIYGSNGFIANNHVDAVYTDQNFNDWNGPLANRVNMTAGKIVKGMPVRGGTNSPSGLFWATDSLIRVSFTGNPAQYWKYDIVSSQTSIMSSNCVVESDGIFYWMGVDRFYLYNGSVQVLPNDKNINWVYDNLNFQQRQKVWATKVPRYNEIWFFYPRGSATECTDAIIYNVKDKIWYDAGQALGARRSCGYTTEVFPSPIWFGWEYVASFSNPYQVAATPGASPPPGPNELYLEGDVTPGLPPSQNFQFSTVVGADFYTVVSVLYDPVSNTTFLVANENFSTYPAIGDNVYPTNNGYTMWQHEYGVDEISDNGTLAIQSSITTCDISWVGGDPSQDSGKGVNRRIHLRRVEPDFVQSGNMTLQVIGRKFARGNEEESPVFTFGPNDGKVDLRIENRESRIKFESNVAGGDYQMGRVLVTAEYGDERP